MTNSTPLPLEAGLTELARAIVDTESVSGNETALADKVETTLRAAGHLEVIRDGDTVIARTHLDRAERVILAGHLDTVPVAGNLPSCVQVVDGQERLIGRGACDMKGGVAVFLALACALETPRHDLTWIFYDHEEVDASLNSLTRLARERPELLEADFAILGEPSNGGVEAGCKGTMRVRLTARGVAAHSGRAWIGKNAIHGLAGALTRLAEYEPKDVEIDGLVYRECLNAVAIDGGIATNVIPDRAEILVNYRFAPNVTENEALAHVKHVFAGLDLEFEVTDSSGGALPGLTRPAARDFLAALGNDVSVEAKQGWTDVARFSALGTPAVNFGPGDPLLAHTDGEFIPTVALTQCYESLERFLR
ncbi:succinyl-diaminopimelate desuccinylase [Dermabacter sp. Marseille-Q3180]|uniref:succinyl-diaminopimelate desuccinylase n=1 Tax=Dermabacter sp. Marseille-Q3180 TaxID=2758090 RepID=UPI002025B0D1|nr:succinyl-diaminopimelate desuccinylase [Dermabacter sp. Marseille-Q3180]